MNILIKLMSIVSLVIAPYIAVPNSTLADQNMNHAKEMSMMHSSMCKGGKVCSEAEMAIMKKAGKTNEMGAKVCSEAEMAAMKKEGKTCNMTDSTQHVGIKSCCEKPGLKDRFK